jgi:hypothetical protein
MPVTNRLRRVPQSQIFPSKSSRFCCSARVRSWHKADKPPAPEFVAYWTNNGQRWISARVGYDVNDPKRTFAPHTAKSRSAMF